MNTGHLVGFIVLRLKSNGLCFLYLQMFVLIIFFINVYDVTRKGTLAFWD